jgi:nitrogen fixation protein FixH
MTTPAPVTGRSVLAWLLGAFAAVTFANLTLIWFALESFTGETEPKSYLNGLDYNKTLEDVAAQRQRPIIARNTLTPTAAQTVKINSQYVDNKGQPMQGLTVHAEFSRPTHEGYDFTQTLSDYGNGAFGADVVTPLPGLWHVRLVAVPAGEAPYMLDYRVIVK